MKVFNVCLEIYNQQTLRKSFNLYKMSNTYGRKNSQSYFWIVPYVG